VLFELLRQRSPAGAQRVYGVVDCDLPVLVVQEVQYILSALFQDLIPEEDGGCRRVDVKIVVRYLAFRTDMCAPVVA